MARKRTSGKALRVQGWIIDAVGYIFSSMEWTKQTTINLCKKLTKEASLVPTQN